MKFTINKRLAALVLATSVAVSQFQTVVYATNSLNVNNYEVQSEAGKVIYTNDFSNDGTPNEVGGVITNENVSIEDEMLKIETNFDSSWDWDSNKHELNFLIESAENMENGALISFDILIPSDKIDFEGQIKFKGALKDTDWVYKNGTDGAFESKDFGALDNGYSKVSATVKVSDTVNGLNAVIVEIIGAGTNYTGPIYIDNIQVETIPSTNEDSTQIPTEENEYYANNFEVENDMPAEVNGVITLDDVSIENEMMKFNTKFDGTWGWDENKHEFNFYTYAEDNIPAGSLVEFDILIPTEKLEFNGEIKFKGALKNGEWKWQDGTDGSFTKDKFEDLGNGYSKATASVTVGSELQGLNAVVIQIIGGGTDYSGAMYLDNIKVYSNTSTGDEELTEVTPLKWNFDNAKAGLEGWEFGGVWSHQGKPKVEYDENIGGGSLKLSLDFTKDTEVSWSEVKLQNNFEDAININGYNLLSYDFIYDPEKMSMGSFKTKLYSNGAIDTYQDIQLENLEDIDGGLKKAKITVKFAGVNKDIDSLILAVIGVNSNYKGDIYIDNIELSQEKAENIYVEITEEVKEQTAINVSELDTPNDVKLVDEKVSAETASLYSYLMGLSKTDKVIFGHENDTHHKGGKYEIPDGDSEIKSDTLDITGSIAGLVGMDTLSFTGDELDGGVDAAVQVAIKAAEEGGIITLSAHMPNFEIVKDKGLDDEGNYDYSGYTPGVTKGDIVQRIMPGGDLNEIFLGYLDLIADYGKQLEEEGVPVLFRPFHENNGSWFWWGKAFCDEQTYKNLYAYTVEYLRDVKGVHNFLYVYSPGGPFEDEADYLSRYPGDEFVDVLAFDMYHDNPTEDDNWMSVLEETIELVQGLAEKKGKLSAVSEIGMRIGNGGIAQVGNIRKDWYNEVLDVVSGSGMPYFMVWANFDDKENFYVPYRMTETTGHEMINEFIDFYNDERSIFAKETGEFLSLDVNVDEEAYGYGYILNPISGARVLEATTISAVIKNLKGNVFFVIKDGDGNEIKKINAKDKDGDSIYTADLTENILEKIGEIIGSIDLVVDKEVISSNKIMFNIKEQEKLVNVVDDFESYRGESALLLNEWATNVGPGCTLNPQITSEAGNFNGGSYGLEFNYKISNAKTSEGWAGMTTAKNVDWSEYDALQLWVKPDGNGQKLVIQITSNGEDFEVFLPEFAATTEPQLLTLKFEDFIGKNKGEFDPANISSIGIWCNTIVPEGHEGEWTVESTMYFDDIKAINTSDISTPEPTPNPEPTPDEDENKPTEPVKPDNGGNNGNNANNGNGNSGNGNNKLPQTGGVNSAIAVVAALGALVGGIRLTKRKKND